MVRNQYGLKEEGYMETVEILKILLDDMLGTRMIEGKAFDFSEVAEIPRNYLNERLRVSKPFNKLAISRCCMILEHFLSIDGKHSLYTDIDVNMKINTVLSKMEALLVVDYSKYKIRIQNDLEQNKKREAFFNLFKAIMESCENKDIVPVEEIKKWNLSENAQMSNDHERIWSCPKPVSYFYGRQNELSEISHLLEMNNTAVIYGISGIGKTELVKKYVQLNANKYNNVLFLAYKKSLKETLVSYYYKEEKVFPEDIDGLFLKVIDKISKWDEDSILIIDNMEILPEMEPDYEFIRSHRFKTIFTTTVEYDGAVELKKFNLYEGALSIFRVLCPRYAIAPSEINSEIEELIMEYDCHTYIITLLARLLQNSIIQPYELLEMVRNDDIGEIKYNVISNKDNKTVNDTLCEHINRLVNIMTKQIQFGIREYTIRYCIFIPKDGMGLSLFTALCGTDSGNDINTLRRLGIITITDDQIVYIHPLMRKSLKRQYGCNYSDCRFYIMSVTANVNTQLEFKDFNSLYQTMLLLCESVKCADENEKVVWTDEIWTWYTVMISEGKEFYAKKLYKIICDYERENNSNIVIHLIWCLSSFEDKLYAGESMELDKYIKEISAIFDAMNSQGEDPIVKRTIGLYISHFYYVIGKYNQLVGAYQEALENYKVAQKILFEYDMKVKYYKLVDIKFRIARCNHVIGHVDTAISELLDCEKIINEKGEHSGYEIECIILLGLCYAQQGEKDEYEKYFSNAFDKLAQYNLTNTAFGMRCKLDKALGLIYLEQYGLAKDILNEIIAWYDNTEDEEEYKEEQYEANNDMSVVLWNLGNVRESAQYKERTIQLAGEIYGKKSIHYIKLLHNAIIQYRNSRDLVKQNLAYNEELIGLVNDMPREMQTELGFEKIELILDKYTLLGIMNCFLTNDEIREFYNELICYDVKSIKRGISKKQYMKAYILCSKEMWVKGLWKEINELGRKVDELYQILTEKEIECLDDEFHMVDFFVSIVYQYCEDYKKANELLEDFIDWCEETNKMHDAYYFQEYLNAILRLPLNYNQYNKDYEMQYKLFAKAEKIYRDEYSEERLRCDPNYLGLLNIVVSQSKYYATSQEQEKLQEIMKKIISE